VIITVTVTVLRKLEHSSVVTGDWGVIVLTASPVFAGGSMGLIENPYRLKHPRMRNDIIFFMSLVFD
jgi:hypothetical protein